MKLAAQELGEELRDGTGEFLKNRRAVAALILTGMTAMGGANRAQTQSWIPLALAEKSGLDSLQAAALTRKSWIHYRAFSLYSLITALSTFLVLPLVLPEAKAAWHKLRGN